MLTPASSTLETLPTSQGAGVRPAFSNSSASDAWFFEDSYIMFERDKETMLITNSSVFCMLLSVSFSDAFVSFSIRRRTYADTQHRWLARSHGKEAEGRQISGTFSVHRRGSGYRSRYYGAYQ